MTQMTLLGSSFSVDCDGASEKSIFFTSPGLGEFRLRQEVLMKIDSSYTLILSVSNSRLGLLDQASVSVAH